MNNLTSVLPTSTSPRFELVADVVAAPAVARGDRDEMYALLQRYFHRTSRWRFEADLNEKETVILLRDAGTGQIG